jgi:hypothetical protein
MNPEEDFEAERQALLAVFDEVRRDGVKLDVDVFQEGRPSGSPETMLLARALAAQVRAITGRAPRFEMCPGFSRSGSTLNGACRPMPTVRASCRSHTGRRSS